MDRRIVTLISDFGTHDYRLGSLMGDLLSVDPSIQIAHISHDLPPFDIDEAAFMLACTYSSYPKGSIHIVSVYPYYDAEPRLLTFEHEGQHFIGPDNGVFSLALQGAELHCYTLGHVSRAQHYGSACAALLGHVLGIEGGGTSIVPAQDITEKFRLEPVVTSDEIRGTVIRIDRYGNVLLNITRPLFEDAARGRPFHIIFNKHEYVDRLSRHYADVDIGTPACRFGKHGFLEVSVRLQPANAMLGLSKGDVVQVKFFDL